MTPRPSRRAAIRQGDLTRCLKAHRDAGLPVIRTETRPDGTIVIFTTDAPPPEADSWADFK